MADDLDPTQPPRAIPPSSRSVEADDAVDTTALHDLGLDSLLGDPDADGSAWRDVTGRARHAGRRRSWMTAAVAAAVLIIVVGGGVLIAGAGTESSVTAGPGQDALFLLPPEGVDDISANGTYGGPADTEPDPAQVNNYIITWRDSSGTGVMLSVVRQGAQTAGRTPRTIEFDTPRDVDGLVGIADRVWGKPGQFLDRPAREVDAGPLDPAASVCVPSSDPSTGVAVVVGITGRSLAFVHESRPTVASCDEILQGSAALRAGRELRVVDEATWRAFMDQWGELSPVTTTTTTPPPTLDPAVADYCAAIERFRGAAVLAPNGDVLPAALPYLEDIRDSAPSDMRPALETMINWLEAGAPPPTPSDVGAAGGTMTKDWVANCQLNSGSRPSPTVGP